MGLTPRQIVDAIAKLSVSELLELNKALRDLPPPAAQPVPVGGPTLPTISGENKLP